MVLFHSIIVPLKPGVKVLFPSKFIPLEKDSSGHVGMALKNGLWNSIFMELKKQRKEQLVPLKICGTKKLEGTDMMTILEAIDARHSVRAYRNEPIEEDKRQQLDRFAEACNRESGLHIFLRYDDP